MVMGLANKIISRMAKTIAVSFPIGAYDNKYASKMIFTGLPVKGWKAKSGDVQKMKKILQIDLQLPTIFVTGGSYGANSVNSYILEHASKILNYANILHVTGDNDYDRVTKLGKNIKGKGVYNIYKFLTDDFNKDLYVSDMVISRASATTLAEISSMAKPSILIPLPTSASNHQYFNAKSFEDMGASVMIEERDFPRINLAILIKSILEDEERYEEMSASAVTAMQTEGAAQIIKDIIAGMIGE
jgi:UDP-N-acetylglucosamine--N-acetylmuramyl-(pentapeptide) pyrophosphoryl-undecaprenol N-acetylglucosamine transferase